MRVRTTLRLAGTGLLATIAMLPAAASQNPPAQQALPVAGGSPPSIGVARFPGVTSRPIPELATTTSAPAEAVKAFVDRASVATIDEHGAVAAAIARASTNAPVTQALAASVMQTRTQDFTRTLTSLSVLGELRNATSEAALKSFVRLPLPTTGHLIEGQIAERISLEELQMKAVQGLAYARTATGDAEVLHEVAEHPSRAVRAEAMQAYLYNHGYSSAAHAALLKVAHPDEVVFLDRPHMISTTTAADFNAQLASYLKLHPSLRPPAATSATTIAAGVDREKESAAIKHLAVAPPAR